MALPVCSVGEHPFRILYGEVPFIGSEAPSAEAACTAFVFAGSVNTDLVAQVNGGVCDAVQVWNAPPWFRGQVQQVCNPDPLPVDLMAADFVLYGAILTFLVIIWAAKQPAKFFGSGRSET